MQTLSSAWSVSDLIGRCKMRPPDEAAWEEFVRRFHPTIRASVLKTFHQKARQEADRRTQFTDDLIDDLIQSVYMRLVEDRCRVLDGFKGEHANSIYQYLGTIATNVVRDYFREARAQKRPKVSYSLDELLETSGEGVLIEESFGRFEGGDSALSEDLEQALHRAVGRKNRERDLLIFKLRYYDGLTLEEITRAMGLKISAISVGSILNRTTKRLKPLLAAYAPRH